MTTPQTPSPDGPLDVLIAGGGVAGLETAFALRELAGDRVTLRILAPDEDFVYRAMSVGEPFTAGYARHYSLARLAAEAGAELIRGEVADVDAAANAVRTVDGDHLAYGVLVTCPGAVMHQPFRHATPFEDRRSDELLHGLVQDIEDGYVRRLAIVVPAPPPWPLPAYELALMASERAWDMRVEMEVVLLTIEPAPLAVFGPAASHQMSRLLHERHVGVVSSAFCEIPEVGTIVVHPGGREVTADRIVSLPALVGPAVAGLPQDGNGFIPVDEFGRVAVSGRVWAAGDATDYPVKQGGVAAQMAATVAEAIAHAAGAPVQPTPFAPRLEGVLLTGGTARGLRGAGADGRGSGMTELKRGQQPPKVAARYLTPHLTEANAVQRTAAS